MKKMILLGFILSPILLPLCNGQEDTPREQATETSQQKQSKAAAANSTEITNRPPLPGEWGYHPADGEKVSLNPPAICWVLDGESPIGWKKPVSYDFELASNSEFKNAIHIEKLGWTTYTHNAPLAPGTWYWRYCKSSAPTTWSQVRSFQVGAEAVAFPCPSRAEQAKLMPSGHPRLFMRPEELPKFREFAKGEGKEAFEHILTLANQALSKNLPPDPPFWKTYKGSGPFPDFGGYLRAKESCENANVIAFAYLITGEKKYGDAAKNWLMAIASWDNKKGQTAFEIYDYACWATMTGLARSYDWTYDLLSPNERATVLDNLKTRGLETWKDFQLGSGFRFINAPFGSHANISWQREGELAIAAYGEFPEASLWFDHSLQCFFSSAPVWGDEDGGWNEGVHYYCTYMQDIVRWLDLQKAAVEVDGLKKPFFKHAADLLLYMAPPGAPHGGFGEMNFGPPKTGKPWGDGYWPKFMQYLERAMSKQEPTAAAHWKWWTEQWKGPQVEEGTEAAILDFIRLAKMPPFPEAKDPSDLPVSKIFHGTGVASFHTTLLDSANDVHLAFKSNPMGTRSHGVDPQNSFFLNAYGDELLETITYRDNHFGPFRNKWVCSTKAHNCVLVNREGQTLPPGPGVIGEIVASQLTEAYDYVQGEAAAAYDGKLKRFRRHLLFLKPDWIVIFDDLEAATPSAFQWMLHTGVEFKVDEQSKKLGFEQKNAGLEGIYLCSAPLKFKQWDKYDPMPKSVDGLTNVSELPNQWHLEASLESPTPQARMITVLVPYKLGAKPNWSAERIENDKAIGVKLKSEKGEHTVIFSKDLKGATAELGGVTTSGFIGVK